MLQILPWIFRMQIFAQLLLLASSAATSLQISCTEPRAQLAAAVAAITSLEVQLAETRRRMISIQLVVRQCESMNATTSSRLGPPAYATLYPPSVLLAVQRAAIPHAVRRSHKSAPVPRGSLWTCYVGLPSRTAAGVACDMLCATCRVSHRVRWLLAAHVVEERAERSLRQLDGGKTAGAGCSNHCLTFQRVSDYALPRCAPRVP